MIYLIGSIFFASLIFLAFKLFGKYQINNLPAIVVNYFTAGIFGFFLIDAQVDITDALSKSWLPFAIGIGFGFIFIFYIMAVTTQKIGASAASVTVKMSVAIPVAAAFFLYDDETGTLKIVGILLALVGIYFSTKKNENKQSDSGWKILLPILLFLGSGSLDTVLKYVENTFIASDSREIKLLTPSIFISAALFGSIFLISQKLFRSDHFTFGKKEIIAGFALGIVNYGSIFCLFSALNHGNWESSMVFPINNVGIVILTALSSVLFLGEKLSKINKMGIAISILALVMISIS